MTVAVFSPFAPPFVGGIESHTKGLVEELLKHRQVALFSHQYHPDVNKSVETIYVDRFIIAGRLPVPKNSIGELVKITKRLKRDRPTLAIVQSHLFPLSLLALIAARYTRTKSLLVSHASGPIKDSNRLIKGVLYVYDIFMRWACGFLANEKIGVSTQAANWISKQGPTIIPNSISAACAVSSLPAWRDRRNAALLVGRLVEGKNSKKIVNTLKNCDFLESVIVIGSGPDIKDIAKLAKENSKIVVLGKRTRAEVFAEMRKNKYFINLSDYPDGLPTVLLEAAASGMFICASGPGVSDLLGNQDESLGFQPRDAIELVDFLRQNHENEELFVSMTRALRQRIESEFTWEVNAKKFLQFEDSLLK